MRVGLYFDLRNPPEWAVSPSWLYGFTLELCQEADRLGIDALWVTEHHQFDDGYLPQPLTMLSAIAARTSRARLGTAVMIAPFRHAADIAEQAALVDIISNGRLDLGLGAGYRLPEFALFGAEYSRRYAETEARVRDIRRMWSEGDVTPAPVQERVPMWLGYQGPQGARRAGVLGENLLSLDAHLYAPYRDGLIAGGHDPAGARMSGWVQSWVSEDPEADWPVVAKHLGYQVNSYLRHRSQGVDAEPVKPVDPDRIRNRAPSQPLGYFHYGTPPEVAQRICEQVRGVPADTVSMWASLAGMPENLVAAHVSLICTQLAPLLRAHNPEPLSASASAVI